MLLVVDGRGRLDARTNLVERAERFGCGLRRTLRGSIGRAIGDRAHSLLHPAIAADPGGVGLVRAGLRLGRTHGNRVPVAFLRAAGLISTERDVMEDDLVASGRFVRIETRGLRTGLARVVTVGFAEDVGGPPGSILVAAGSHDTSWAQNLLSDPACHVTVGDRSFEAFAEPLGPADHARAIRELILRYGTPAEGLGRGTSFRLRPVVEGLA
jgi:deazaflavin-dependent oxidoreductase (nitroreductase family)